MKLSTKIVAYLGGFFMGLLAIPGVGDFLANAVTSGFGIAIHAYPKLTIFAVAAAALAAWLRSPHKAPQSPTGQAAPAGKATVALLLSLSLVSMGAMSGCSATNQSVAQTAVNVIQGFIAVAQAEVSSLPPSDQAAFVAYWGSPATPSAGFVPTLNSQLATCNASVSSVSLSPSSKFQSCFDVFASGLANPTELAALRVLSPTTQAKVQSWILPIVVGVNVALTYFGAPKVAPPAVVAQETTNSPIVGELVMVGSEAGR